VHLHPLLKREFELLLAAFGGSQDSTCPKKVEDCEMLNLGPHEDIWGAQFDFLSGNRSLHNLGGAEQRRGPSFCGPTTKRYVDGEDDISEAEQQVIWQRIYGPAVDEHLIAKDNWTKQPGKWRSNRPQPVSAAPRGRQLIAIELTRLW